MGKGWKYIAAGAMLLGGGAFLFAKQPKMDPLMTKERKEKIKNSPHYVNGEFVSETPREPVQPGTGFFKDFLFPQPGKTIPKGEMITEKTDLKTLPPDRDLLVWMGHSSFYMQFAGKKILIDPVFSEYAAPVAGIDKAFGGSNIYTAADLPETIDVLALTHDHWDHLDYDLVKTIEPRVKSVVCGLGNGGYFEKWGYPLEKIHEGDWGDSVRITEDFTIHILPTHHFSGRLLSRNQTLPVSFAFISKDRNVYLSGDGGYDGRFKTIGQKFGKFDLAIIENGQYNIAWHSNHMLPEESARAADDLRAKAVVPCHNSKYPLSVHNWDEPMKEFSRLSEGKSWTLETPKIGQVLYTDEIKKFPRWWEEME